MTGVERVINGPVDMIQNNIINMAVDNLIPAIFDAHYDDFEFKGREMIYNYYSILDWEGLNTTILPKYMLEREADLWSLIKDFRRLANSFPDYPLWQHRWKQEDLTNENGLGWWDEIRQGSVGNCYAIASFSAVATHPQYIKDIFL